MNVTSIRTHKITKKDSDISAILDRYLSELREESVVVVTSKIVAICEGRVIKIGKNPSIREKEKLVAKEADYYLTPEENQYNVSLTIKGGLLIPTAGIDESNTDGYYALWPSHPQKSANAIRQYLAKKFSLKKVGVIISDSKTTPLRWGTTGIAVAHSGFAALNSYMGKPDIFGRKLKMTQANIMDGLAVAAVLAMGEGKEQTPLAVIEDVPFVKFQKRNPTAKELKDLRINIEDDLYSQLLKSVQWRKGKGKL